LDEISFEDFKKVVLRTGKIVSCEDAGDNLYKLKVKADRERVLLAGLKKYYSKDELLGKTVIVVVNLEPKKMRGAVSEGMILAADKEGEVSLLTTDKIMPEDSEIR